MLRIFALLNLIMGCLFCNAQRILTVQERAKADFSVFVETEPRIKSDLNVFQVSYSFQAKGNYGYWFTALHPRLADKKIYFTNNRSDADLVIKYVTSKKLAGWISLHKQHLLN